MRKSVWLLVLLKVWSLILLEVKSVILKRFKVLIHILFIIFFTVHQDILATFQVPLEYNFKGPHPAVTLGFIPGSVPCMSGSGNHIVANHLKHTLYFNIQSTDLALLTSLNLSSLNSAHTVLIPSNILPD